MASQTQAERDESCFGRAARAIRRALARICGRDSTSSTFADVNDGDMILRGFGPVESGPHLLVKPDGWQPCADMNDELSSFPDEEDPYPLIALGSKLPPSSNVQLFSGKTFPRIGASLSHSTDNDNAYYCSSGPLEGSKSSYRAFDKEYLDNVHGPPPPHCLKRLSSTPDFPVKKKHKDNSLDLPDFKLSIPPPSSDGYIIPFREEEASTSRVGQDETLRKDTACPATLQHATDNNVMNSNSDEERVEFSHIVPSICFPLLSAPPLHQDPGQVETDAVTATYKEFMPDENDEDYRFLCSSPGLYECSVTGLVFHMEGEGDVVYRTVPWDRKLLAQHHKKPAGPLFDVKCVQQSMCRLHLPHCEISSTGGSDFLSVAHVKDEGVEFITPQVVTESHVVINITGFSGYGNVKDEDSPPDPVRALVLLFYRPPADPDPESLLNVLLLPRNVVLRDVLRIRKKSVGDEIYLETSPHCKLHPKQEYTLSTCPEDNSVLVQPKVAEFDYDDYDNFFPSFQVNWETKMKYMKLILRDTKSSNSVWERQVWLSSKGVKRSGAASALNLPPNQRLQGIRSRFIDGISGPVLKSLLDGLFEKTVITDAERESAQEMQNKRDKARFVIDMVRRKGEAASSEMIDFLCEADPFLCEHLDLI